MHAPGEDPVKEEISKYLKPIYALTLNLIGGDPDKAYAMTVNAFAQYYAQESPTNEWVFLCENIYRQALMSEWMPQAADFGTLLLPEEQAKILYCIRRSLFELPIQQRWVLLLRDQLNLPYSTISEIIQTSSAQARVMTLDARNVLQTKVRDAFE